MCHHAHSTSGVSDQSSRAVSALSGAWKASTQAPPFARAVNDARRRASWLLIGTCGGSGAQISVAASESERLASDELIARDRRTPAPLDVRDDLLHAPGAAAEIAGEGIREVSAEHGPLPPVRELAAPVRLAENADGRVHSQSSWPAGSDSRWRARRTRCQMPAAVQRRNRFQAVLHGPNRPGKSRYGAPVRSTPRMALTIMR